MEIHQNILHIIDGEKMEKGVLNEKKDKVCP